MANVITLNQIQAVMSDIAVRHYSINTFVCSPTWDYDSVKNLTFPVLHMRPVSGVYERSDDASSYPVKELNIELRVLDLVSKGKENRDDVNSDTEQMLNDVVQEINEHPYYQRSNLQLVGDVNLTFLDEISDTEVNGVMAEFTLRMKNSTSFCGLPFTTIPGYSFPGYSSEATYANVQYLTCSTVTACTTFQNYVSNAVSGAAVFTGGTVTGPTIFTGGFSANTIYSGSTNLYDIFLTSADGNDITRISNGLNTYTGGTANNPTVNISAATLTYLSAVTISGGTIYSGGTDLSNLFLTVNDGNDITRVGNGLNTYTGGTDNNPTINISAATLTYLSAVTLSAGTIYSGGTNLYSIFQTIGSDSEHTHVQPGLNIYTGGTTSNPTVNLNDNISLNSVSGNSISATTFYSGSTNLSSLLGEINTASSVGSGNSIFKQKSALDLQFRSLSAGTNITLVTGDTITINASISSTPFESGYALSDETTQIVSGSTAVLTVMMPFSGTISSVFFSIGTSGSTSSAFDVKKNGTTIFSTKPTIDANEFGTNTAATSQVITGSTLNQYDTLTFFIDSAGTGAKSLKTWVLGTK